MEGSRSSLGIVLALFVWMAPAWGQVHSLSGEVTDPSGERVRDAQLSLFDRTSGEIYRTTSDVNGTYRFINLLTGDYLLEASAAASVLTASRSVVLNGSQTLDVDLALSGMNVEVIVTASSTPLSVSEIAKAVDVVERDELWLRNETSVGEAIRNLPGVRIQQLRGPGGLMTIQTRGLRNRDTALLIDGMRFRDAASINGDATAFFADMDTAGTERIEFLRGSGSSLYGSHAVGGVVNVTSVDEGGPPHGELRLEGGGLGMIHPVASISGGVDDDRFTYSSAISHMDVTQGIRGHSPYRNTSNRSFLQYNVTPSVSVTGRVWWSDAEADLGESPTLNSDLEANFPAAGPVPAVALPIEELLRFEGGETPVPGNATFIPDQIDPDSRRESSFLAGGFTLGHQLTAATSYRVSYLGVDTNRLTLDGPAGPNIFDSVLNIRDDGRVDTLQGRVDHALGNHQLVTLGYEFEREAYVNVSTEESPALTVGTARIQQRSHAFFAQDQVRLFDGRLQVALSGRLQSFDLDIPSFSGPLNPYSGTALGSPNNAYTGDAAVAYFLESSQTKFRAHAGNSYRAPSAFERFGASFFFGSFSYFGDPRISPERSIALDAGIDQWLLDTRLQLSGTVFYTDLQETILFDSAIGMASDPFNRVFGGYRNGQGGIARGVELSGRLGIRAGTRLQWAYTYTNSDSNTPTIGSDFFKMLGLSDHTMTLTASHWFTERFNATFDLFAVSDYPLPSPFIFGSPTRHMVFDGPVKLDLALRYDWPVTDDRNVEIYAKIDNVLNREYYEDGFRAPGAWVVSGLRFLY